MLNKCQIKKPTSQEAERAGDHSFCSQKCAVTCFSTHSGSSRESLFSWALDALLFQRGEGVREEREAHTAIFFTIEHISVEIGIRFFAGLNLQLCTKSH